MEIEGLECRTPRETLKTAFKAKWLADEELWLRMLDDRNLTSHTYDEPTAREIYANIKEYYDELARLAGFIRSKYPQAKEEQVDEGE